MNTARRLLRSSCIVSVVSIFVPFGVLYPQTPVVENLWMTDGAVNAVAYSGNTIYIGGNFTFVGQKAGNFAVLNSSTGSPDLTVPSVGGSVRAIVSDGSGGWYIGGDFTSVGGVARNRIAHIRSDKSVDASWNPNADGAVYALAFSGSRVYVGGQFTQIGDSARNYLAALDVSTGKAATWNPNVTSSGEFPPCIYALALSDSTLYAGGIFTKIGDSSRASLAAIDTSTGMAMSWDPKLSGFVMSLAVSPNGAGGSTVYTAGLLMGVGDSSRTGVAAIDAFTGQATNWNPDVRCPGEVLPIVFALTVSGSTVYVGGQFTGIGDSSRNLIAAVDTSTGRATSWNPDVAVGLEAGVLALAVLDSTVYLGGQFAAVGGSTRNNIAAVNASTGTVTGWKANTNNLVYVIAVSGSSVCAGGYFTMIGGEARNYIAALDASTGKATVWNPDANSNIFALAVSPNGAAGSTVYAGGSFTSIGDSSRNRIAALDASTGKATGWNPDASGTVITLAVPPNGAGGSTVYAGGDFTSIGGSVRNHIAALDTSSGHASGWDPNADARIWTLAVSPNGAGGPTVYAGGAFSSIGDSSRNRIAALDASTGKATGWNPKAGGEVNALAVLDSTVYAGGTFNGTKSIGDSTRDYIAAIDTSTGIVTSWNPVANSSVLALAISPNGAGASTVYAGGVFTSIGGQPRGHIAALDASTGLATSWNPNVDLNVYALALDFTNGRVYVGGDFLDILGSGHCYFAGLTNPDDHALPVQLASFTATGKARAAELHWTTASEIHNYGFEIERHLARSTSWQKVAFIQGSGASTSPRQYSYVDKDLAPGRYAYRVKQIDKDGSFTYTPTVEVEVGLVPRVLTLAHNYPNPFNPSTTIEFTLAQDGKVTLKVFDLLGREVTTLVNEELKAGVLHRAVFDASRVSSGLYFCRLETGGKSLVKKMLLMK